MSEIPSSYKIQPILKKYWGYDSFRPLQEAIIFSVLKNKNTLALLPTGGGKSICFQIPVLAKEGIGIVISPLIALMKDQVENLQKKGIKAKAIYSGMTYREIDVALDNCIYGDTKFLYISPERATTELFRERVKKMKVNLLAIDEAHCISQWGHDFRPSYKKIIELLDFFNKPVPILAVTATANQRVMDDIITQLQFKAPAIFKQSFERKNLGYLVLQEENKEERLLKILRKANSSGIVYVNTRKKTVEISAFLNKNNIKSDFYHGGLPQQERMLKQQGWINETKKIIVSTNAFGMGIDKPNVRVVVHLDIPANPEAYFQEAGRAGRDGQKAYATLLYKPSDKLELEKRHKLEFPDLKTIKSIYNALGNYYQIAIGAGKESSFIFDIGDFGSRFSLKPITCYSAIKILELNGYFELSDAIYHPSRLKITTEKNALYQIQIKNKLFDAVIRQILRTYSGVFDAYQKINSTVLARELKLTTNQIHQVLVKLTQFGVIDYIEAHDSPMLTFTTERINENNLKLTKETYTNRKKIKYQQLQFMIRYCESHFICRNRLLLSYFDEKVFKNCGICDVCITSKNKSLTNYDFETISTEIKILLKQQKMEIHQMITQLPFPEQKTVKVVQFMLDNGALFLNKMQQLEITK